MIPSRRRLELGFGLSLAVGLLAPAAASAQVVNTDWLILQPEVGFSYANVLAFQSDMLLPGVSVPGAVNTSGFGSHFGALAGMRFGPFAFGLHGDLSRYSSFDIGTLGPQLQLRLPIPIVQPYARVNIGYTWMGAIDTRSVWMCTPSSTGNTCPSVSGWTVSAGVGLDFWVSRTVTLGGGLDFYVLNFNRSASPSSVSFTQEGNAVGLQIAANLQAALHF